MLTVVCRVHCAWRSHSPTTFIVFCMTLVHVVHALYPWSEESETDPPTETFQVLRKERRLFSSQLLWTKSVGPAALTLHYNITVPLLFKIAYMWDSVVSIRINWFSFEETSLIIWHCLSVWIPSHPIVSAWTLLPQLNILSLLFYNCPAFKEDTKTVAFFPPIVSHHESVSN